MSIDRTCAALSVAALFGAAGFVADANAQATNCATYGKLALQQQKDNESFKCGFTGPEWSSDLKAHLAWCNSVAPDEWKQTLQGREQKLAGCKAGQE